MKATLRQIAQQTNVHFSTVSHILNDTRGNTRVSEETRRRVLEVAEKLGYIPNRVAQQLRRQRSEIVGLLVGGLENPFFARMVSLCSEALEQQGYDVVLAMRRSDESNDLHLLQALISRQFDGILLWSETITEVRERVQQPDMATTIVMGYPIPGRDCISANLTIGVRDALEHLRSGGCEQIGYFAPEQAICREGDPRYDVYCQYMQEQRRSPSIYSYSGSAFDVEAARIRAEQLADDPNRPDALLCFNDMAAIGALMGLRRKGVRVPDDVALVGCDDLPLAAQLDVTLTSIHYPLEEMCRQAVQMLLARMSGPKATESQPPARFVELSTTLCIRESSLRSRLGR